MSTGMFLIVIGLIGVAVGIVSAVYAVDRSNKHEKAILDMYRDCSKTMEICNLILDNNEKTLDMCDEVFNKKTVKIKKLKDSAIIPKRGSNEAGGYDLYACLDEPITIKPHTTVKVGTGLSIEIPQGYFGGIFARSGLATKQGIRPSNCVGVCDSDYRGEYIVALHNDTDEVRTIDVNERIAQLIVLPYLAIDFEEVDKLSDTDRGSNGFGSTGTI